MPDDEIPLLQHGSQDRYTSPPVSPLGKHESQEDVFFFAPDTPSQRSLMDVKLPDRPNICRIMIMACLPCCDFPLCTEEKKQEFKKVPRSLILIVSLAQIVMFIVALGLGGFATPQENWLLGPTTESLVTLGAKEPGEMRYDYEVWRYFTPIFLHAGIVQLIVNIFGQLRMGLYLERKWKWYVFIGIYALSGIGGVALGCDLQPNQVSVSSSAAFMGVMGAYFAQLHLTWFKMEGWQKRMNLGVCLMFIVLTFLEGIGHNNVDTTGHVGGLVVGLVLGYSYFGLQFARRWNPSRARAVPVFGIFCTLAYFAATISVFYTIIPVPHTES